eukprot:3896545-Amphidinium_carterae.1
MATACSGVGVEFAPMVIEALSSAMRPSFRAYVDFMAGQHSSIDRNLSHSCISLDIAQRMSAMLKRSGYGATELPPSCML